MNTQLISLLTAACLVGLAGSVHCIVMCGGIVSLFGARMASDRKVIPIVAKSPARSILLQQALRYNLGRITTYTSLGALLGAIGTLGTLYQGVLPLEHVAFVLANLIIMAIGLHVMGLFPQLRRIEVLGGGLWQRLQTTLRAVLASNKPGHRIGLGLLWGFVPCGMVYSMLLAAMFSGSMLHGALLMLAFGLGTLPGVIGLSLVSTLGQSWLARHQWRRWAGAVIVVFGVLGLVGAQHATGGLADMFCRTSNIAAAP